FPNATKAFFAPCASMDGSTLSVPRIGTSPRTKPPPPSPVQPLIWYLPSARTSSMTTLACPPDPMMTTASGFMLLKDGPLVCAGPDKRYRGRWQFPGVIFCYLSPGARQLFEGKQSQTMGEKSTKPFDRPDSHAF